MKFPTEPEQALRYHKVPELFGLCATENKRQQHLRLKSRSLFSVFGNVKMPKDLHLEHLENLKFSQFLIHDFLIRIFTTQQAVGYSTQKF